MAATVLLPIEAHPIETRTGDICSSCLAASLTVHRFDLVRFTDDAVHDLGHYEHAECGACGASETTR
jgi:hypothetical protein